MTRLRVAHDKIAKLRVALNRRTAGLGIKTQQRSPHENTVKRASPRPGELHRAVQTRSLGALAGQRPQCGRDRRRAGDPPTAALPLGSMLRSPSPPCAWRWGNAGRPPISSSTPIAAAFASAAYRAVLAEHGLIASMSRKANCYYNALMESFWSSLKYELVY